MARTYTLSEAIQMLEKNRKLEFTQHTDVDGIVFLKLNDRGWLVSRNAHGEGMIIGIDGKWELVQKPVTFMEAVENGKKIRVEHPRLCMTSEYCFPRDLLYELSVHHIDGIFRDIILNGKWYIKED